MRLTRGSGVAGLAGIAEASWTALGLHHSSCLHLSPNHTCNASHAVLLDSSLLGLWQYAVQTLYRCMLTVRALAAGSGVPWYMACWVQSSLGASSTGSPP